MGLERVKVDIVEKARHQASLTLIEAKKQAKEILASAEQKLADEKETLQKKHAQLIQDIQRQELARTELEAKKAILRSKKEIIDQTFAAAKEEIINSDKMADIIARLLDAAKKELQIEYIYCNKKDTAYVKKYKVKETPISGGIIAENKEQTIRIDYSFDTLFSELREQYLDEVARTLFE